VEGGAVLPPAGGWEQGADFVVFAEGPAGGREGGDTAAEEASAETEAIRRRIDELEKNLLEERQARERLVRRVAQLELAATTEEPTAGSSQPGSSKQLRRSGRKVRAAGGDRSRADSDSSGGLEVKMDEASLLGLQWRHENTSSYILCLSEFLKKTPMKEVAEKEGSLVFTVMEKDMEKSLADLTRPRYSIHDLRS
jgi:hypothetical protein